MADIIGTPGNDNLHGTGNDDTIVGDAGNDIISGNGGNDTIDAGDGDDQVDGGNGDDYILGGAGNDSLTGGNGIDWLDGGDGDDTITYADDETAIGGAGYDRLNMNLSGRSGPTSFDLTQVFFGGTLWSGTQTISGFEALGTYVGSAFDDLLNISAGQSDAATIDTGAGNDTVYSGAGNDTINLGDGADTAMGGDGNDTISGGAGNDVLDGQAGADHLLGGLGNDSLILDETQFAPGESIDGGADIDTLYLTYHGGGLTMGAIALANVERLVVDSFSGYFGVNSAEMSQFTAAEGLFQLSGSGVVNLAGTVFGGISGRSTTLVLDSAITSFTFNSAAGSYVGVYAGDGGVTITGGLGDDGLVGGAGADVLSGGDGRDGLVGSTGDRLYGGAGDDRISVNGTSGAGIVADGGTGYDILAVISDGPDFSLDQISVTGIEELNASVRTSVAALGQFNRIFGYFTITGSGPSIVPAIEVIDGTEFTLASGITSFDLSGATYSNTGTVLDLPISVIGNDGANLITGTAGRNQIDGGGGNDILVGGSLYDALYGGDGDDILYGNAGGDQLYGGAGRDELYGGDGDDGLYYGEVAGAVVVGEVYSGGAGYDTLSIWGNATPPGGVFDLTTASFTGIEHLSAGIDWATRLTTTQLQSFQMLSGWLVLADATPVTLSAGQTLNYANIQLSDVGQVFNASAATVMQRATLRGGAGADTITSGSYTTLVYGGNGNDVLTGSAEGGQLYGEGGNDRLVLYSGGIAHGGDGYDTLVANGAVWLNTGSAAVTGIEAIELNGGSLRMTGYQFAHGFAFNTAITGSGTITVYLDTEVVNGTLRSTHFFATQMASAAGVSFNVTGTSLTDAIKAALTSSITVDGGGGVDQIRGGNLADTINGGEGNDKIMGLGGADLLTGGTGADQFRYMFASDSGLGSSADRILDFTNGQDKLDFRALDADPLTAGRQTLNFIGTAAFSSNGTAQVRYGDSGADTLVEIDLDGNGMVDMQIVLVGHAGQPLAGTDFSF